MKLIVLMFFSVTSFLYSETTIDQTSFQSYGHFKQMIKSRNITGKTTIDTLDLEKKEHMLLEL